MNLPVLYDVKRAFMAAAQKAEAMLNGGNLDPTEFETARDFMERVKYFINFRSVYYQQVFESEFQGNPFWYALVTLRDWFSDVNMLNDYSRDIEKKRSFWVGMRDRIRELTEINIAHTDTQAYTAKLLDIAGWILDYYDVEKLLPSNKHRAIHPNVLSPNPTSPSRPAINRPVFTDTLRPADDLPTRVSTLSETPRPRLRLAEAPEQEGVLAQAMRGWNRTGTAVSLAWIPYVACNLISAYALVEEWNALDTSYRPAEWNPLLFLMGLAGMYQSGRFLPGQAETEGEEAENESKRRAEQEQAETLRHFILSFYFMLWGLLDVARQASSNGVVAPVQYLIHNRLAAFKKGTSSLQSQVEMSSEWSDPGMEAFLHTHGFNMVVTFSMRLLVHLSSYVFHLNYPQHSAVRLLAWTAHNIRLSHIIAIGAAGIAFSTAGTTFVTEHQYSRAAQELERARSMMTAVNLIAAASVCFPERILFHVVEVFKEPAMILKEGAHTSKGPSLLDLVFFAPENAKRAAMERRPTAYIDGSIEAAGRVIPRALKYMYNALWPVALSFAAPKETLPELNAYERRDIQPSSAHTHNVTEMPPGPLRTLFEEVGNEGLSQDRRFLLVCNFMLKILFAAKVDIQPHHQQRYATTDQGNASHIDRLVNAFKAKGPPTPDADKDEWTAYLKSLERTEIYVSLIRRVHEYTFSPDPTTTIQALRAEYIDLDSSVFPEWRTLRKNNTEWYKQSILFFDNMEPTLRAFLYWLSRPFRSEQAVSVAGYRFEPFGERSQNSSEYGSLLRNTDDDFLKLLIHAKNMNQSQASDVLMQRRALVHYIPPSTEGDCEGVWGDFGGRCNPARGDQALTLLTVNRTFLNATYKEAEIERMKTIYRAKHPRRRGPLLLDMDRGSRIEDGSINSTDRSHGIANATESADIIARDGAANATDRIYIDEAANATDSTIYDAGDTDRVYADEAANATDSANTTNGSHIVDGANIANRSRTDGNDNGNDGYHRVYGAGSNYDGGKSLKGKPNAKTREEDITEQMGIVAYSIFALARMSTIGRITKRAL